MIPFLMLGLVWGSSIHAETTDVSAIDNVVYLKSETAAAGGQHKLSVQMKNVDAITGYEFKLQLPEGLSFAKDEDGFYLTALSLERTTARKTNYFDCAVDESGRLHVLCSTTAADEETGNLFTFSGNDGEVCTVTIDIPEDIEAGDYPIILSDIVLTPSDADKGYETARLESTLTIEVSDGRLHFDENAATLPKFTAGEKGDVTMQRTIKAGNWSTIVLPFNLTKTNATAIFGSDVEMAQFSGFVVDYGEDEENVTPLSITVNFTSYTIPARGNLSGGTPILIKTSKDISTIKVDNVTLVGAPKDVTVVDDYGTAGKFTSTFVKGQIPAYGLFLSGNKFWYAQEGQPTAAFRGWFELDAVLGMETDFGVKFNFLLDDVETRISDVNASELNGDVYDLAGRKMQGNRLSSGIYIIGGKKVSVK